MAIQDEMYNMIVRKINKTIAEDNQKVIVDYNKAKEVAKMLASLSTEPNTAESLVNEYIKSIDNICKKIIGYDIKKTNYKQFPVFFWNKRDTFS